MSASTHTALMEKPVPARSAGDNAAATTVESTIRRGGAAAICNEFTFGDEALPKEDAEAVAKKLSAHRPCNFSVKPEAVCATSSLLSEPALHLANEMSGASAHESQTRADGKDLVRKHGRLQDATNCPRPRGRRPPQNKERHNKQRSAVQKQMVKSSGQQENS